MTKIKKCMDCGKNLGKRAIYYGTLRCHPCYLTFAQGKNHSNYKGGYTLAKYFCKDCNAEICWATAINGEGRCKSCSRKMRKGKNSPAYKNGISLIKRFCKDCGKELGRCAEALDNIRCASCARLGENHPNWIKDRSLLEYADEFTDELKEEIRNRDRRECQLCHKEELDRKLDVHHIDYNKKNCNEENLISLCNLCHMKTNANRKYWTEYFSSLVLSCSSL